MSDGKGDEVCTAKIEQAKPLRPMTDFAVPKPWTARP